MEKLVSHADDDHEGTRRDFLYYATGGAGAVAVGAAVWPLVNQMNPSADVQALSSIRVDVGRDQIVVPIGGQEPAIFELLEEIESALTSVILSRARS